MTHRIVVVFGDVKGHRKPFFGQLRALGITTSPPRIPDHLTVLQVGDLIGVYPEPSEQVVRTVHLLRDACPDQWIQLLGANEARFTPAGNYFRYSTQHGRDIDFSHQQILNHWWEEPNTGVAAVLASDEIAPTLITHAGITSHIHRHLSSGDPYDTAEYLNTAARTHQSWVYEGGHLLGRFESQPGPLLASPYELWASWQHDPLPFDQLVGHGYPYDFNKQGWWNVPPLPNRSDATLIADRRMTWWQPDHSEHGIAHIGAPLSPKSPPEQLHAHTFPGAVIEIP